MSGWARKVRGVLGMAVTWGIGWFGLSAAWWGITLIGQVPLGMILSVAAGVGVAGAIAGTIFAGFLGLAEGRRSFDQLSYGRLAVWGILGGLLVGIPFIPEVVGSNYLQFFGLLAGLGAGSATGSLAVARLADDRSSLGYERPGGRLASGLD